MFLYVNLESQKPKAMANDIPGPGNYGSIDYVGRASGWKLYYILCRIGNSLRSGNQKNSNPGPGQ